MKRVKLLLFFCCTARAAGLRVEAVAFRLRPGEELKQCLLNAVAARKWEAAYVATCVGSVSAARLRMASHVAPKEDATSDPSCDGSARELFENHEIVSLVGTLGPDGGHLHVSLSDGTGAVVGGHLLAATVFTTAEVAL